jgi:hypothetical protein
MFAGLISSRRSFNEPWCLHREYVFPTEIRHRLRMKGEFANARTVGEELTAAGIPVTKGKSFAVRRRAEAEKYFGSRIM